jgi:transposase-like protein
MMSEDSMDDLQQQRSPALIRSGSDPSEAGGSPSRSEGRRCPWCGSTDTRFVQRGFVGPTDERDQYFTCRNCDRLTYEIISRTMRDMRLGQFRAGGTFRDSARQTKYHINRVLKVGMNEFLLYLKPITRQSTESSRLRARD